MIEQFSHEYDAFFEEQRCEVRWEELKSIYTRDYDSFRVLFLVETLALLDKWREPTTDELKAILNHKIAGGIVAIQLGSIIDLLQAVWPLEVAKYDVLVYKATSEGNFRQQYFMTWVRSYATAVAQAWWAFETLMNDFAGIIAKERKGLDQTTFDLLQEKRSTIDKTGAVASEPYYQPLLSRLQFIYRLLTGEELDRGARQWQSLVELKDARDAHMHRIGKAVNKPPMFGRESIVLDGFSAVRDILARVFTKTPEFAGKFVYKYLACWSCGSESPFMWDGNEGGSFYVGLGNVRAEMISGLFAPLPGSFHTVSGEGPPEVRTRQP